MISRTAGGHLQFPHWSDRFSMTRTCRKFVCDKFRMTLTVVMLNQ